MRRRRTTKSGCQTKTVRKRCRCFEKFEAANKDLCGVERGFDIESDQVELSTKAAAKAKIQGGPGHEGG